jgi:tetratricopeptide (TPR) repeat protein
VVNLQRIRQDYGQLLARYRQLASAIATMEAEPPQSFLARVIGAADRWRAIDPDPTAACQTAAQIFGDLGATERAWDYLTTPLAARPNEAAPWVNMAQMLRGQGLLELADRAYASAFEAEGTNAQILWDRAQTLLEAGRKEDAKKLLRQVAEGEWPPQFNWIQTRAKQYVESE